VSFDDSPIRRKLIAVMLLTSGAVLLFACCSFIGYEYFAFRSRIVQQLETLGKVMANSSTAALAFDNQADAAEVLAALRAERHIVAAALYTREGKLFARYPAQSPEPDVRALEPDGYRFRSGYVVGFAPVAEVPGQRLGTLYLKSDLQALHEQLTLYSLIAVALTGVAFLVAYALSRFLQSRISHPILTLADVARQVSERRDYSVRAQKLGEDELGRLTDAFNEMLNRIQEQDTEREQARARLQVQLTRLDLLNQITRAIAERQDLASIFQVVVRRLEDHLPIDFGCICLYDPVQQALTVRTVGVRMQALATELAMTEESRVPVDRNGLSRCVRGELVYEPDIVGSSFPFPQRLARGGLRSVVIAPLSAESVTFGVLLIARRTPESFVSADCEFVRQLCDHVALAAHQAQLYTDLQRAYEELHQTQQTVLQQERLRALGQMASGVAHDINNAISPVALYTESLLERECGLSEHARRSLEVIQRAVNDVAHTVSRMREFYRRREPQLMAAGVDLNRLVREVIELTRARWRDLPQQQGIVIDLQPELASLLPTIVGAESEVRDALTNLVFNAIDAMPAGGKLTIRTRSVAPREHGSWAAAVCLEVSDTGIGMDETTRQHCLEPFFTTKGERGTGMGLAMVYGMAQRHSADLEIESAPGSGTTVRVMFPISLATDAPTSADAKDTSVRALRILLVDDDPLLLQSLRDTLVADGHAVTATNGGTAGIETFTTARERGESFDIVITDLGMPYVDGRRVAAAIKAASISTPVILLTGWGQRLLDDDDVPAGVDRVLNKPPKLRELRSALGALSRRNQVTKAART
jgi:signal transduction histidine kinase/ActR/RegA family two-component response regulator/HAMP domain-containing protein